MTEQQIWVLIYELSHRNTITQLQKDILNTWNELHKIPVDTKSAYKQITSNKSNHPDVFAVISAMPGAVLKSVSEASEQDIVFTLKRQLEGLIAKETLIQANSTGNTM